MGLHVNIVDWAQNFVDMLSFCVINITTVSFLNLWVFRNCLSWTFVFFPLSLKKKTKKNQHFLKSNLECKPIFGATVYSHIVEWYMSAQVLDFYRVLLWYHQNVMPYLHVTSRLFSFIMLFMTLYRCPFICICWCFIMLILLCIFFYALVHTVFFFLILLLCFNSFVFKYSVFNCFINGKYFSWSNSFYFILLNWFFFLFYC